MRIRKGLNEHGYIRKVNGENLDYDKEWLMVRVQPNLALNES